MRTDRCGDTGRQEFHAEETEETLQCKSQCIAMQRLWKVKCVIIAFIIGTT